MTTDKILHALAGAAAALLVGAIWPQPALMLLASGLAGASKEVWDRASGGGHADWADYVATLAGGVAVVWLVLA